MSEEEEGTPVLGKRTRPDGDDREGDVPKMPSADVDDSSDEEIGSMPTAAAADSGTTMTNGRKKKRAGESSFRRLVMTL